MWGWRSQATEEYPLIAKEVPFWISALIAFGIIVIAGFTLNSLYSTLSAHRFYTDFPYSHFIVYSTLI